MIIIHDYFLAILLSVIAMICWGSWPNTQKMAAKTWRFELYYWDFTIGIFLTGLVAAFTIGSLGSGGRTFIDDLGTANLSSIGWSVLGGILWNVGTLLLVAAIATAGLAVAFPIVGGVAWLFGLIFNYFIISLSGGVASEKPAVLWIGAAIVTTGIIISGLIYDKISKNKKQASAKGISMSVIAGLIISFFYGFVVKSLDPAFVSGGTGSFTPYTALMFFTIGIIISTLVMNPIFMKKPVEGEPVTMKLYWKGTMKEHVAGITGGMIWMLGMILSFMAVGVTNPAITYALSNAALIVAILWGAVVWKEFKDAPKGTNRLMWIMFVCFILGLVLITYSNS
jgi:glucose uptake protein